MRLITKAYGWQPWIHRLTNTSKLTIGSVFRSIDVADEVFDDVLFTNTAKQCIQLLIDKNYVRIDNQTKC